MKQYYVAKNGVQEGPYEEDALKAAVAAGKYPKGTLIWGEGMGNWEPIEKYFALPVAPPPIRKGPKKKEHTSGPVAKHFLIAIGCFVLALGGTITICSDERPLRPAILWGTILAYGWGFKHLGQAIFNLLDS